MTPSYCRDDRPATLFFKAPPSVDDLATQSGLSNLIQLSRVGWRTYRIASRSQFCRSRRWSGCVLGPHLSCATCCTRNRCWSRGFGHPACQLGVLWSVRRRSLGIAPRRRHHWSRDFIIIWDMSSRGRALLMGFVLWPFGGWSSSLATEFRGARWSTVVVGQGKPRGGPPSASRCTVGGSSCSVATFRLFGLLNGYARESSVLVRDGRSWRHHGRASGFWVMFLCCPDTSADQARDPQDGALAADARFTNAAIGNRTVTTTWSSRHAFAICPRHEAVPFDLRYGGLDIDMARGPRVRAMVHNAGNVT